MLVQTVSALGVLSIACHSLGAWSTANLVLADRPGEQVQPKIVPDGSGAAYVSWFDNATGGYDVSLQRIDAQGNEVWAHDGVLVADRSFSSTQDYGLSVDTSGNALLTFRDDRVPGVQITAAAIDATGAALWGAAGVQLTADGAFHGAPGIAGTSDGQAVVAWTNDADIKMQRLDATGTPQWGAGITLSDGAGGEYLLSDIHASDAGSVILSWIRQASFLAPKHLYAQKFDPTGAPMWNAGAPVIVFDAGSLQFGNFPEFVTDGAGGAVFGWYSSSPSLQCFAQHVLSSGAEAFAHNGAAGSINAVRLRVSPGVAFDASTGDTLLAWTETNALQSQFGVYAQRFDASGTRRWTDDGAIVRPLSPTERTWVRIAPMGADAGVYFVEGTTGSRSVLATRLDATGAPVWTPDTTLVSTLAGDKSRLVVSTGATGAGVCVWQEGATGSSDILAHNVNADGTLGLACDADVDSNGLVDVNDIAFVIFRLGNSGTPGTVDGDADANGFVDINDIAFVIFRLGPCP